MRLVINNVGKVGNADIAMDGITVLTGRNDTGKSTVGKLLYSVFSTFFDATHRVQKQRRDIIVADIRNAYRRHGSSDGRLTSVVVREIFPRISEAIDSLLETDELATESLHRTLIDLNSSLDSRNRLDDEELKSIIVSAGDVISLGDLDVLQQMLDNQLEDEFGSVDMISGGAEMPSSVEVEIKGDHILLEQDLKNADSYLGIIDYIDLAKRIVYIDDPFVLDDLDPLTSHVLMGNNDHRRALLRQLGQRRNRQPEISEVITRKRLRPVMEVLEQVGTGDIVRSERGEYRYESGQLTETIPLVDVSTGIKSFMILKQLLLTGQLEENGVVVLDEPEVHLHPQWQINFAELVVVLQREFGINFLITTHSIDFLSAIEYHTKKHGAEDACHYYMMEANRHDGLSQARETSDHLDESYRELSRPFVDLTNRLDDMQ